MAVAALAGAALFPSPATAATPTLTTQASPSSFPVGVAIFDVATLSGGENPTGMLTFDLFGPGNPTCTGPPVFSSSVNVAGNGNYTSQSFPTNAAGDYQWVASYSGDANNTAVATACGDPAELVSVSRRQTLFSTQASPQSMAGTITDTATLANGAGPAGPTGTITFDLFGPDNAVCAGAPIFTDDVTVAGNGMYTSAPFTPTSPGTYRWVARYSGDANNLPSFSVCADPAETVVVTSGPGPVTPTLATTASPGVALGGQVTDTATLAGGSSPTGTITFRLFGPDDATCSGTPAFVNTKTVAGNGSVTSDPFVPRSAGTYRWVAAYSGDAANNPVTTACTDPAETVVVTSPGPTTPTLTTTASPGVAFGGQVTDTATLAGGLAPTGTITFRIHGPDDPTCSTSPMFINDKPVTGNGTYSSDPFTPTAAGTYRWVAVYNGDLNNTPVTTACGDTAETVVVTGGPGPVTPVLATTASPGVAPGGQITDTARLSGGTNPSGSITFSLFGPDDVTCAGPAVFVNSKIVAGNGSVSSDPFMPLAAGTYRWVAAYSGDAGHNPVTTACGDPEETVVVADVPPPALQVTKTADLPTRPEPGGTFTFTVTVTNTGSQPLTVADLADSVYGNLSGQGTCGLGAVLAAAGGTYTCSFPGAFTGNAGLAQTDIVTVTATDAVATHHRATASVTVRLTDVPPSVAVSKTATPATLPEPGGTFTFEVAVTNTSFEAVTLTGLVDTVHGDLDGRGTCVVGGVLAPGATTTCSYTAPFTGTGGQTQTGTVTATAVDDDGTQASASDDATVSITSAAPTVAVEQTADVLTRPEPGGFFTHTVTVTNTSSQPLTLVALVDEDLNGRGTCRLPQTLAAGGGAYSCTFPIVFTGNAGDSRVVTVTATAVDASGRSAMGSDSVTLALTDVAPSILVTKSAAPNVMTEPGGQVLFAVRVTNTAFEAVTVTRLVDDVHGDLDGRGTCAVGGIVAPGATWDCSFTAAVTGRAGQRQTDTVGVTVVDDDGTSASGTAQATVSLSPAPPPPAPPPPAPSAPPAPTFAKAAITPAGAGARGASLVRTGAEATGVVRLALAFVVVGLTLLGLSHRALRPSAVPPWPRRARPGWNASRRRHRA